MSSDVPAIIGNADEVAITVAGLSKCYHIYDKPRDRLKQFIVPRLQGLVGLEPANFFREFWALRDVSFEIRKGEAVGIVGRNGSGKSTLLQIICGTLSPTSGTVNTSGRIAALLELGSGFNPEFTGRENIYLNAAILGLSRDEVDQRFDDIVAFADIGQFIDQPVKTYSSGMVVRLAFSVAINVNPDILIVDEALSVGDELFQRKCFSRIEGIRASGATILFVSHSGGTVIELCDRAVLMDAGEMLDIGAPKQIVGRYQKLLYASAEEASAIREQIRGNIQVSGPDSEAASAASPGLPAMEETFDPSLKPTSTIDYDTRGARLDWPVLQTLSGIQVNSLVRGRKYRFAYNVGFDRTVCAVRFGMLIKTISGFPIGGALSAASRHDGLPVVKQGSTASVEFVFDCQLNPGIYFMNAGVFGAHDQDEILLHRLADAMAFRVLPVDGNLSTEIVDFCCTPRVTVDE